MGDSEVACGKMPRRERKKNVKAASLKALAELRAVKESGKKRTDQFEDSTTSIFEEVEESEYSERVSKRRQQSKSFVVDDKDFGYGDDDGEELWTHDSPEAQAEKGGRKRRKNKISAKQSQRINSMFLASAGSSSGKKAKSSQRAGARSGMAAEDLGGILADFESNPLGSVDSGPRVKQQPEDDDEEDDFRRGCGNSKKKAVLRTIYSDQAGKKRRTEGGSKGELGSADSSVPVSELDELMGELADEIEGVPVPQAAEKPFKKVKQGDWWSISSAATQEGEEAMGEAEPAAAMAISDEEDGGKYFFFLDALTIRQKEGTVFMFGKVPSAAQPGKFESCFLEVRNLQKVLYIAPRETRAKRVSITDEQTGEERIEWEDTGVPVSHDDVCQEFHSITSTKFGLQFNTKTKVMMKPNVKRSYCFERKDVPRGESLFVKVKYFAEHGVTLPSDMAGETFTHVFGTNQSMLERLLLKQRIMGPQWLKVKQTKKPSTGGMSWCKQEWSVDNPNFVLTVPKQHAPPDPPLSILSLKVNTILNHKKQANEIVMVSGLVHHGIATDMPTLNWEGGMQAFTAIRKLENTPWPKDFQQIQLPGNQFRACESERELLSVLMARFAQIDPDVVIGHNFIGFDLDVLLHRMQEFKVSNWSQLGRLNRKHMPKLQTGAGGQRDSTWEEKKIMGGRLICDSYLTTKDLAMIRQASYSLKSLAKERLGIVRYDLDQDNLYRYFQKATGLFNALTLFCCCWCAPRIPPHLHTSFLA